jgi:mRNA-degrading endonuclease RelE of RelBE toxin-antitoxin system
VAVLPEAEADGWAANGDWEASAMSITQGSLSERPWARQSTGVAYRIRFAASAEKQLAQLTARQQAIVLDAIKVQLGDEPFRETRNRKPRRPNPLAPWELRVGELRIFYEEDADDADLVNILAVGIKRGNRLFIAGKEIAL